MSPARSPLTALARARRHDALVKIASGGTAAVWVGAPVGATGPLVAIKVPHAHLADDPAFRRALAAEATIASRLRHPNVASVLETEEDDDGIALVMTYVEGCSLSDLIRSWSGEPSPRAAACAIRVALDTCAGLVALHDLRDDAGNLLGLVHRDVSPANVLVGIDGVASIADFGLAKPLYAVERTTSEGALRGKLGYMAPEYVRGKEIDLRIDVFAMGVVIWESLARKRLFRGENDAATLERVQRMDAPRLSSVVPELGDAALALDEVLARALAKDPSMRTANAGELARELLAVATAHQLVATHEEVAGSFGPSLVASLDERRARVASALATRPTRDAPRVAAMASVPADPAAALEPTVRTRAAPRRFVVPLVLLATTATLAAATVLRRAAEPSSSASSSAASSPPSPALSLSPSSSSAPPPSPPPSSSSSSSPPPAGSSSASSPRAPASPATAPRAAPEGPPGYKKPRPNPYATAPSR